MRAYLCSRFASQSYRFAPSGNVTISACPPGTHLSDNLRSCESCQGGEFNLVAGRTCKPCPLGATCPYPYDRLEAQPDWWYAHATRVQINIRG